MSVLKRVVPAALLATSLLFSGPSMAETLTGALAKAYQNNASLNAARAGVRVTNEGVPLAKSGYRPQIVGSGSASVTNQAGTQISTGQFGVQIQQAIFDGYQTQNNVRAAEARVRASNESLRNTEQNVLFNAVAAFMDVIRDRRVAGFRQRNLEFLAEQVRSADSRFEVGEGTRTDVAQAQASRSAAEAQLSGARAQVQVSEASYRQLVGENPGQLQVASPAASLLPPSMEDAFVIAMRQHPAIMATQHLVDVAGFAVNAAEGALLPQVSAQASVQSQVRHGPSATGLPGVGGGGNSTTTTNTATIGLNLTVPIYSGGRTSAQVRQSKESLGQARIEVDVTRDEVRQAVASAWTQYVAAREVAAANRQLVSAADLALSGVTEERNVGQRTTLDVLNAQADVINAQINLASSERDQVVASYAILSAIGALTVRNLGLPVNEHRPAEHYDAVKDLWYGTSTPDGR